MRIMFILLITLVISVSTFSQENTSTQKISKSFMNKAMPDRISHFSMVAGPSLGNGSDPNEFDGNQDQGGINSWHQISLQYQLDNRTRLVVNPRFTIERNNDPDQSFRPIIDNPVFGINRTWYSNGKLSFAGSINTVLFPLTDGDRDDGLRLNPGGLQTLNYKLNDKVSVGTWLWFRYRYFEYNKDRSKLPIFTSPYVTYNISDKVELSAFYQHNGKVPSPEKIEWDDDDSLNLMTTITINKYITLMPIITLFRETNFSAKNGNLNLWLSGRLF